MAHRRRTSPRTSRPKSGHYAGTTTQDGPISFDVGDGGTSLTCLTFKIDSWSPGQVGVTDEPITITGVFPISPDGHFGQTVTGNGIRAGVDGTVTPAGTASGKLLVALVVVNGGNDVECSSGEVRWQARLT